MTITIINPLCLPEFAKEKSFGVIECNYKGARSL
jgi:hypothetical protein